jgi:HAD superfamily hydrolase (TIGR01509 family)
MPASGAVGGPRAVLWDMDGTLVDSEKVWTVSLRDTARLLGGELSAEARADVIGSDVPHTLEVLFADLGLRPDPCRAAAAGRYLLERTAELFAASLTWRPGAREALAAVRAAGWPAALVTNTGRDLTERALETIGREWFAATVCGDEVERGKPAPDIYLRAAQLLGVDPADCLAVEDSPRGAASAQRAGAAVLVVPCDVAVPAAPGRVERASLVGATADILRSDYAQARSERAA